MILVNDKVINGTVNGASVTATQELNHAKGYSVQVKWSGSSVSGTVKLQASINGSDFHDLPDATKGFSGNSGGWLWEITDANYQHVKIVATSISGDVAFQVWLLVKTETKLGG